MKVNPAELILDFEFYPRSQISAENVTRITRAREAGVKMPAVVADKKTKKVVDGFHRVTDAIRHELPEIAVEWRTYGSEAEMLEDAIRLNAGHGRPLCPFDHARCIVLAERFHLEPVRLAEALCLTPMRVDELRLRKTAIGPDACLMPIKLTSGHRAGQLMSKRQVIGNERATGMRPIVYVNQVINILENGLLDVEDERLMAALGRLRKVLVAVMRKFAS